MSIYLSIYLSLFVRLSFALFVRLPRAFLVLFSLFPCPFVSLSNVVGLWVSLSLWPVEFISTRLLAVDLVVKGVNVAEELCRAGLARKSGPATERQQHQQLQQQHPPKQQQPPHQQQQQQQQPLRRSQQSMALTNSRLDTNHPAGNLSLFSVYLMILWIFTPFSSFLVVDVPSTLLRHSFDALLALLWRFLNVSLKLFWHSCDTILTLFTLFWHSRHSFDTP